MKLRLSEKRTASLYSAGGEKVSALLMPDGKESRVPGFPILAILAVVFGEMMAQLLLVRACRDTIRRPQQCQAGGTIVEYVRQFGEPMGLTMRTMPAVD